MKQERSYIPGGTRGPVGYHNPLPPTASRWRKVLRWIYDQIQIVSWGFLP